MPRKVTPLTDTKIRQAKPDEADYYLNDGGGLSARITTGGAKSWYFQYKSPRNGKRAKICLGAYPNVSLAIARKFREEYSRLVRQFVDPKDFREQQRRDALSENSVTLAKVFEHWLAVWAEGKQETTVNKAVRQLELYALPKLGYLPVSRISAPIVIECLKPLEKKGKLETLSRVREKLTAIMTFAVHTGLIPQNPLLTISAAFKTIPAQHQPAMHPSRMPELLNKIETAAIKPITRLLIMWSLHTLLRPAECAGARWDEINLDTREWNLPADRMKGRRRGHCVPLSDQSMKLLRQTAMVSKGSDYLFPSERSPRQPANSQTVNRVLTRLGFKGEQTAHGFRSLGSTALNEAGFPSDHIEAALAHIDSNTVRRAYNRSAYIDQRRPMMQWWSDCIEHATGNFPVPQDWGVRNERD